MVASLLAGFRLFLFVLWVLLIVPPFVPFVITGYKVNEYASWFWRGVWRLLGMTVVVNGKLVEDRPLMIPANHASYLDIITLGGAIPGTFVSKAEVAQWPGIGLLARLAQTVFIERKRSQAKGHRDQLTERLERGEPLIMFPEGTSNDGNKVLPFKSALFSVAERNIDGKLVTVQPVSLAYTRFDGLPMGYGWRPLAAWYGDMDLAPHLWTMLGFGCLQAEITFHEPISMTQFKSRKQMAEYCHMVVSRGVSGLLSGRELPALPAPDPLPEKSEKAA